MRYRSLKINLKKRYNQHSCKVVIKLVFVNLGAVSAIAMYGLMH